MAKAAITKDTEQGPDCCATLKWFRPPWTNRASVRRASDCVTRRLPAQPPSPSLPRPRICETASGLSFPPTGDLGAESSSSPRLVPATAPQNGLSANQLFAWRRLARERNLGGESALPGSFPCFLCRRTPQAALAAVSTSQFLLRIWKSGLTHALSARELKVMRRHGPFWLSGRTRIVSRICSDGFFAVV